MDNLTMTPRRPYLLRAFYEWLVENDLTPHLVVDAMMTGVRVPEEYIQDGQIILNVAPRAVGNLEMSNEAVTFHARFGGRPHSVIVPIYAVQAIYARENGAGTMFEPEEGYEEVESNEETQHLSSAESLRPIEAAPSDEIEPDSEPPRPKGRPSLKVVK